MISLSECWHRFTPPPARTRALLTSYQLTVCGPTWLGLPEQGRGLSGAEELVPTQV
jgi:hypothetical protein